MNLSNKIIFKGLKKWFLSDEEMAESKREHDETRSLYLKRKQARQAQQGKKDPN